MPQIILLSCGDYYISCLNITLYITSSLVASTFGLSVPDSNTLWAMSLVYAVQFGNFVGEKQFTPETSTEAKLVPGYTVQVYRDLCAKYLDRGKLLCFAWLV